MYKRYFRMKDPRCKPNEIEWIEMAGSEFYRFVNSPEGRDRHFIDMDDVVLEASESEVRSFRKPLNVPAAEWRTGRRPPNGCA